MTPGPLKDVLIWPGEKKKFHTLVDGSAIGLIFGIANELMYPLRLRSMIIWQYWYPTPILANTYRIKLGNMVSIVRWMPITVWPIHG